MKDADLNDEPVQPIPLTLGQDPLRAVPAGLGRFQVTGVERDKNVFKVPSLRNVAQLGRTGTEVDKASIVKFLGTLTGQLEGQP